ncbi:unnamed protein product [Amoebophrya sp. A25]|nr:unnamed protein product [Amoebophrya sp. A25]|eukprot:GSA25T00017375001.1
MSKTNKVVRCAVLIGTAAAMLLTTRKAGSLPGSSSGAGATTDHASPGSRSLPADVRSPSDGPPSVGPPSLTSPGKRETSTTRAGRSLASALDFSRSSDPVAAASGRSGSRPSRPPRLPSLGTSSPYAPTTLPFAPSEDRREDLPGGIDAASLAPPVAKTLPAGRLPSTAARSGGETGSVISPIGTAATAPIGTAATAPIGTAATSPLTSARSAGSASSSGAASRLSRRSSGHLSVSAAGGSVDAAAGGYPSPREDGLPPVGTTSRATGTSKSGSRLAAAMDFSENEIKEQMVLAIGDAVAEVNKDEDHTEEQKAVAEKLTQKDEEKLRESVLDALTLRLSKPGEGLQGLSLHDINDLFDKSQQIRNIAYGGTTSASAEDLEDPVARLGMVTKVYVGDVWNSATSPVGTRTVVDASSTSAASASRGERQEKVLEALKELSKDVRGYFQKWKTGVNYLGSAAFRELQDAALLHGEAGDSEGILKLIKERIKTSRGDENTRSIFKEIRDAPDAWSLLTQIFGFPTMWYLSRLFFPQIGSRIANGWYSERQAIANIVPPAGAVEARRSTSRSGTSRSSRSSSTSGGSKSGSRQDKPRRAPQLTPPLHLFRWGERQLDAQLTAWTTIISSNKLLPSGGGEAEDHAYKNTVGEALKTVTEPMRLVGSAAFIKAEVLGPDIRVVTHPLDPRTGWHVLLPDVSQKRVRHSSGTHSHGQIAIGERIWRKSEVATMLTKEYVTDPTMQPRMTTRDREHDMYGAYALFENPAEFQRHTFVFGSSQNADQQGKVNQEALKEAERRLNVAREKVNQITVEHEKLRLFSPRRRLSKEELMKQKEELSGPSEELKVAEEAYANALTAGARSGIQVPHGLNIVRVDPIENVALLQQYLVERERMREKYGYVKDSEEWKTDKLRQAISPTKAEEATLRMERDSEEHEKSSKSETYAKERKDKVLGERQPGASINIAYGDLVQTRFLTERKEENNYQGFLDSFASLLGEPLGDDEALLFHGVSPELAEVIAKSGFAIPSIAATGSMLGKGIYFGDSLYKADEYSKALDQTAATEYVIDVDLNLLGRESDTYLPQVIPTVKSDVETLRKYYLLQRFAVPERETLRHEYAKAKEKAPGGRLFVPAKALPLYGVGNKFELQKGKYVPLLTEADYARSLVVKMQPSLLRYPTTVESKANLIFPLPKRPPAASEVQTVTNTKEALVAVIDALRRGEQKPEKLQVKDPTTRIFRKLPHEPHAVRSAMKKLDDFVETKPDSKTSTSKKYTYTVRPSGSPMSKLVPGMEESGLSDFDEEERLKDWIDATTKSSSKSSDSPFANAHPFEKEYAKWLLENANKVGDERVFCVILTRVYLGNEKTTQVIRSLSQLRKDARTSTTRDPMNVYSIRQLEGYDLFHEVLITNPKLALPVAKICYTRDNEGITKIGFAL